MRDQLAASVILAEIKTGCCTYGRSTTSFLRPSFSSVSSVAYAPFGTCPDTFGTKKEGPTIPQALFVLLERNANRIRRRKTHRNRIHRSNWGSRT